MNKISIAMTTYNGEKFLEQQLLSIFQQTLQPDEVIICDDGSTDNTVMIAKLFIEKHNLHDYWRVLINEQNKGLTKNFLDCASMTTGDIIFFSDQDDIWENDKIYKMTTLFEKNDKVKAMSCTVTCIDTNGDISESVFNKIRKGKGNIHQISFSKQVRDNRSAGLTLAIRRELLDYVKPIIFKYNLPYDLPMGLLASAFGGYYLIEEPLVYRRVHSKNLSTPKYTLRSRIQNVNYHIDGRRLRLSLLKACVEVLDSSLENKDRVNLHKAIDSLKMSLMNLESRKVLPLFFDIFSLNPMINRLIAFTNIMCVLFGDYTNVKIDNGEIIK
jgi:glycosyltransferase involved in cell wall biosynthesis